MGELTDVVSDYISVREGCVILGKTMKVFPSERPWAAKSITRMLSRKQKAIVKSVTLQ